MKTILLLLGLSLTIYGCGTANSGIKNNSGKTPSDTVRIANDSLEYEIIVMEPGFDSWLLMQPRRGYYEQNYLEIKNKSFVSDYNSRVIHTNRNSADLYTERINYDPSVDYGYEVNYMLYNYFVFFQEKYKQHLTGGRN